MKTKSATMTNMLLILMILMSFALPGCKDSSSSSGLPSSDPDLHGNAVTRSILDWGSYRDPDDLRQEQMNSIAAGKERQLTPSAVKYFKAVCERLP